MHSILYYINRDNPLGPAPSDPTLDPQFTLWENAIKKWAEKNATSSALSSLIASSTPINNGDTNQAERPVINIKLPLTNQTVTNPNLEVQIEILSPRNINRTEYYINNNLWETLSGGSSAFTKQINFLNNGYQSLKVRACNDLENCGETTTNFNVLIPNNPINTGKNSLKIINPSAGITAKSIDFPLPIKIQVAKPERTTQINVLVRGVDGTITTIENINNPGEKNLNLTWKTFPPVGAYALYAELQDWNGDKLVSNEIKITAE